MALGTASAVGSCQTATPRAYGLSRAVLVSGSLSMLWAVADVPQIRKYAHIEACGFMGIAPTLPVKPSLSLRHES